MNKNINLGKVDKNSFKESKSASIARLILENNNKMKTHFMEMDKTPNLDGKIMILEGPFERITVEVQIKTLPKSAKPDNNGNITFPCDTKAMNCVVENVTFNPVVLLVVDTDALVVYYKVLTKDYVTALKIGTKKTKNISISREDQFEENSFIKKIYQLVKITDTDTDCYTKCANIRDIVKKAPNETDVNFQLVYSRGDIMGYFSSYTYSYGKSKEKSFVLCEIQMKYHEHNERLHFQLDKDYVCTNRVPSNSLDITDADIGNILLEVAKEIDKPILYKNAGVPVYWFNGPFLWQLRAEQINLEWYMHL